MELSIRRACPGDGVSLKVLESPGGFDLERELLLVQSWALMASLNGELSGYVLFRRVLDQWDVINLFVESRHRRRGVALALMLQALESIEREGGAAVCLEVRQGNAPAVALYRQLGFLAVGRRVGYYRSDGEDAIRMSLGLPR